MASVFLVLYPDDECSGFGFKETIPMIAIDAVAFKEVGRLAGFKEAAAAAAAATALIVVAGFQEV